LLPAEKKAPNLKIWPIKERVSPAMKKNQQFLRESHQGERFYLKLPVKERKFKEVFGKAPKNGKSITSAVINKKT